MKRKDKTLKALYVIVYLLALLFIGGIILTISWLIKSFGIKITFIVIGGIIFLFLLAYLIEKFYSKSRMGKFFKRFFDLIKEIILGIIFWAQ